MSVSAASERCCRDFSFWSIRMKSFCFTCVNSENNTQLSKILSATSHFLPRKRERHLGAIFTSGFQKPETVFEHSFCLICLHKKNIFHLCDFLRRKSFALEKNKHFLHNFQSRSHKAFALCFFTISNLPQRHARHLLTCISG